MSQERRRIPTTIREDLEDLVDKYSLNAVLDALFEICWGKAEHVRENWQDQELAEAWERVASYVEGCESKISKQYGILP